MARLQSILLALSTTLALVQAQSLIASTLPACAQQCALLQQASQSCQANPAAAQSCFCQSALLAQVKTNPAGNICAPTCSDAEWGQIASWYSSTCANGGAGAAAGGQTTLATQTQGGSNGGQQTIVAASGPDGTSQPTPTANANSGGSQSASGSQNSNGNAADNYKNGQEWWSTHYGYVIMLIVLLLAFSALGFGGAYWYRRHQRYKAQNPAAFAGGNVSQWAPNSSTHDFNTQAERQARGALAQQPGTFGGAAMVERANSKKSNKGKTIGSILKKNRP